MHVMQHQYHRGRHTSTKTGCHLTYTWRDRLVKHQQNHFCLLYHINVSLSLSKECKIQRKMTLFLILHRFIIMTDSLKHNSVRHGYFMLSEEYLVHIFYINLQALCVLYIGQAFRYSPENAFYIFNQQIYFII